MRPPRLELVKSRDAGDESPFEALLALADRDAEAAEGLALAYAALERHDRDALVASVVHDARRAGRSPAGPLALLLAVEPDRELAETIARALAELEPPGRARGTGWIWGSEEEGGVALAREAGPSLTLLGVRWRGAAIDVSRPEPVRCDALERGREMLEVPTSAEMCSLDAAIDRLAERLWRTCRDHGPLPAELRALVAFLAPYS